MPENQPFKGGGGDAAKSRMERPGVRGSRGKIKKLDRVPWSDRVALQGGARLVRVITETARGGENFKGA